MTSAVVYARVSTDEQEEEGTSLDTQVEACLRYASDCGYEVNQVHLIRETWSGFMLKERRLLRKVRDWVASGEVQVIVCYALDRLSRKQTHTSILFDEVEEVGARIEFVTEKFEDGATGTFVRQVKAFAAELEREKIAERTMRGLRARSQSGKPRPGRKAPYGYLWRDEEKSGYVRDPETAPTLEWIFLAVAGGMSLRQVARRLNEQHVPTPTGRSSIWRASTLLVFLTNPTYMDRAEAFKTIRTKNQFGRPTMRHRPAEDRIALPEGTAPALIDAATFDSIQERLRLNQERCVRNSLDPEAALLRAGYAKCGYCGGSMVAQRSGTGGKYINYRCGRNQESDATCRGASMPAATLDAVVWSRASAVLVDPSIIGREVERMRRDDPTEADLARVDGLIANSKRQHERLVAHLTRLDPDSAESVYPQLEVISARLRALAAERERITLRRRAWEVAQSRLTELEQWCKTVAANLGDMTYERKRLAFDALGVVTRVYRADHEPRYEVEASIPLGANEVVFNTR